MMVATTERTEEVNAQDAYDEALIAALGAEIDGERSRLGLTQEEVFKAAGLSKSAYLKLENGQPGVARTVEQIRHVAQALGLTTGELITRAETTARDMLAAKIGGTKSEQARLRAALRKRAPRKPSAPRTTRDNPGQTGS